MILIFVWETGYKSKGCVSTSVSQCLFVGFGWVGVCLLICSFVCSFVYSFFVRSFVLRSFVVHSFASMGLNTSPCVRTCSRILQKLWAGLLIQCSHCVSTLLSIWFFSFCLFVHWCSDLLISSSPPLHPPVPRERLQALRQAELDRIRKEHLQIAQEQVGSESKRRGAFCVHNDAERGVFDQAEELEGERRRLQEQTRVLMWAPQESKFQSLASCFSRIMFYLLYLGSHIIWEEWWRVLFQVSTQISDLVTSHQYIKEWWGVQSQNKIRMANMLFIQLHGSHLNTNPASPCFFSRCFSGQGVLH